VRDFRVRESLSGKCVPFSCRLTIPSSLSDADLPLLAVFAEVAKKERMPSRGSDLTEEDVQEGFLILRRLFFLGKKERAKLSSNLPVVFHVNVIFCQMPEALSQITTWC
jgi:hypothetical protein